MSTTTSRHDAAAPGSLPEEVRTVVRAARDKKAIDLVVLDLRPIAGFTDFFVVCSGQNARQVQAIADAIEQSLKAVQVRPAHVEGYERADWVLLDYFDFIVHVFGRERREFYALERLWGSAERVELAADLSPRPQSART